MLEEEKTTYHSLFKSNLVLGGAQLIQMLITILRSKFIAVFFGSTGMGINAILQSTITTISNLSSFGIFQSAVRDISKAHESSDWEELSRKKKVFEKLVILIGAVGSSICLFFAPFFSKFIFGDNQQTWLFIILSPSIFFMALANGKAVVFQGTRNLNHLVKASLSGAFFSLIICIPLYYFYGKNGIALSIVFGYFLLYLARLYYSRKIRFVEIKSIVFKDFIEQSKPIIKLGTLLMLSSTLVTFFSYLTIILIGKIGTIEDVGFFQGASSLSTQSIIIVISILASDFFPRLSAISHNNEKSNQIVNQQIELVTLVIGPIMMLIIGYTPLIVSLILSDDFLPIVPMLRFMAASLLFKGVWLTMSYVILANGDRKGYFIFDVLVANGFSFLLNVLFYIFWGLNGLGISFFIGSLLVSFALYLKVRFSYRIKLTRAYFNLLLTFKIICLITFVFVLFMNTRWFNFFMPVILFITFAYSYIALNKKIGLTSKIRSIIFK
jgi:O-antigen/teichoic acid export membrane protein